LNETIRTTLKNLLLTVLLFLLASFSQIMRSIMRLNIYSTSRNERSSSTFLVNTHSDLRLDTETFRKGLNTYSRVWVCVFSSSAKTPLMPYRNQVLLLSYTTFVYQWNQPIDYFIPAIWVATAVLLFDMIVTQLR